MNFISILNKNLFCFKIEVNLFFLQHLTASYCDSNSKEKKYDNNAKISLLIFLP